MALPHLDEILLIASRKDLAETGGGHNHKGVDFQRCWAVIRLFELEKQGASDYLILFETAQDVAELDSSTAPQSIRIYQVKKKDRGDWTWGALTNLPDPKTKKITAKHLGELIKSPLGKLWMTVSAFSHLQSSGVFVSNQGCNIPLHDGTNAATALPSALSLVEEAHRELLARGLISSCAACEDPDLSVIQVERVPIHPDAPVSYALSVVADFLINRSPRHAGQARALLDALLAKIGPLGAKTDSCRSFDELRRERGYSRQEFVNALATLEAVPDVVPIFEDLMAQVARDGTMGFLEMTQVRLAATDISRRQLIGSIEKAEETLIGDVDDWLSTRRVDRDFSSLLKSTVAEMRTRHGTLRESTLTAHVALRIARQCADLI